MGSESAPIIFFFPFMSAGHLNPMLDLARLFSRRGAGVHVISTPSNAALAAAVGVHVIVLPLPPSPHLPDGWDASSAFALGDFHRLQCAAAALRPALRRLLAERRPDCLVSDMFLPWTTDVAGEIGIPRLVFHGMSLFSLCALHHLKLHRPHDAVRDDDEPFLVPGLPDELTTTRSRLPDPIKTKTRTEFNTIMDEMSESENRSYGVVVNSFREMEPSYGEHFRTVIGKKAWQVGPVSLCKTIDDPDAGQRSCLTWLDGVEQRGSVIYVSFGSLSQFSESQNREIAAGLEGSGVRFVWAVRGDQWAPDEGWDAGGRGLVVRGWAPQVRILGHRAVGGFLTHCGWNSVLEGASVGVSMATWPVFGDQFLNELLVVDVLRIGVRVRRGGEEVVRSEEIERAVREVMGDGEEEEGRRRRAKRVGEAAVAAIEKGGSSYEETGRLMEELIEMRNRARPTTVIEEGSC